MIPFDKNSALESIKKTGKNRLADLPWLQLQTDMLIQKNKAHYQLITENFDRIRQYQIATEVNQKWMEADLHVHIHFDRIYGIRYYAQKLREYARKERLEAASLMDMHSAGYENAIRPMGELLQGLEADIRKAEKRKNQLTARYENKAALLTDIGYERYSPTAQSIRDALAEKDAANAELFLRQLKYIVENNGKLAKRVKSLPLLPPAPYQMQNLPLLETLRQVLTDKRAEYLSATEGRTAEEYRQGLLEYCDFIAAAFAPFSPDR